MEGRNRAVAWIHPGIEPIIACRAARPVLYDRHSPNRRRTCASISTCSDMCSTTARPQRPHRHRHALGVRLPDALRPGEGLSGHHHQEAASEVDHPRAAVVPGRRHQHQIPERQRRHDLGRMGRRERRPRPGLRQAMALLADGEDGKPIDQISESSQPVAEEPSFAPADRLGVEPGRGRRHGAAALPLPVPVLCRRRQALLPALPALGRHLPRRAVQHRVLRAADDDGGAGERT